MEDANKNVKQLRASIAEQQNSMEEIGKMADEELSRSLNELRTLQKIIGDFHPTENSMTYRQLSDENRRLQENLKKQEEKLSSFTIEIDGLKKILAQKEAEISQLRNQAQKLPAQIPQIRKKKPLFSWRPKEQTEEEKRALFSRLLFSSSLTDFQVSFLAYLAENDNGLPSDALLQLTDPRLSEQKMTALYEMLCSQYHCTPCDYKSLLRENRPGERPEQKAPTENTPAPNVILPLAIDDDPDAASSQIRMRNIAQIQKNLKKGGMHNGRNK